MLGLLFATLSGELHLRAGRAHRRRDRAADTLIALRELDGLEWRAISGEDPTEIGERVRAVAAALRTNLESVVGPSEGDVALAERSVVYTLAVEDEIRALIAGDTELALEIDETRVDPAFELAITRAKAVAEHESQVADRTDRNMRRLIKATTGLTIIGGGLAAWLFESRRRRSIERERERRTDLHFRSLIESSSDVITTVTGEGQLNQVSPRLGRFSEIVRSPKWDCVASLLGDGEPYERWRRADIELQQSGSTDTVTLELITPAGMRMHIEAIGSMLAGSTTERVWVWRDVSSRRELELQLSHLAFHDPLTGMANRAHFVDRASRSLQRAAKDGEPTSVLLCDLDDFKKVTTPTATMRVTNCWASSASDFEGACGPVTRSLESAAMSSWSSSRTPTPTERWHSPAGCSVFCRQMPFCASEPCDQRRVLASPRPESERPSRTSCVNPTRPCMRSRVRARGPQLRFGADLATFQVSNRILFVV